MSIIKIVRRNIMFKPLQSLVACCVVMASIAMAVVVLVFSGGCFWQTAYTAGLRRRQNLSR